MLPIAEFYEKNKGLVYTVSKKGYGRFQSVGASIDFDDVFQEMSMVFMKAYEGFDESKGFKFTTYFFMAAYNKLNTLVKKVVEERIENGVHSIEEMNDRYVHDDGDSFDMSDVMLVDHQTPESYCQINEFMAHATKSLSPLALWILNWSLSPPPEVLEQLRKAEIHAEYGRSIGIGSRSMSRLSQRYIGNFIVMLTGIPNFQVTNAIRELAKLEYVDAKKFL